MHRSLLRVVVSQQQRRLSRSFLVGTILAGLSTAQQSSQRRTYLEGPNSKEDSAKEVQVPATSTTTASTLFNVQQWEGTGASADPSSDFWNKIFNETTSNRTSNSDSTMPSDTPSDTLRDTLRDGKKDTDLAGLAGNFMKLFSGGKEQQEDAIAGIIEKARQSASQSSDLSDEKSFGDLLKALEGYKTMVDQVTDKYISSIDFSTFTGTALFYYLEQEDEVKNPSWKRRKHRFFHGIDMKYVKELNEFLELSSISYLDTVDEIREGLEKHQKPCEIIYAEVNSEPGKPANFVAIPRDQPKNANYLEVVIGVRGTNSLADVITDVICEDVEYRGGAAHKLIVESGKYLVDLHMPMLEELLKNSGKSKLRLLLTGHSLGAGAASIAGMEFNDHKKFDVRVVGFGCPALLTEDLAAKASYITVRNLSGCGMLVRSLRPMPPILTLYDHTQTVVNDADMVPRMSGISVANLLLDLLQFDWYAYAERDGTEAVEALHQSQPFLFNKDLLSKALDMLSPNLKSFAATKVQPKTEERKDVALFPPGQCIHIYRDGVGFAANVVPNKFFGEIDVTRRMLDDHLIHSGYEQTFLQLMRQHTGDHNFRFDEGDAGAK
jgi:hypothetical protein